MEFGWLLEFFTRPGRWIAKIYVLITILGCVCFVELGTGILSGLINNWRLERLVTLNKGLESVKDDQRTRELLIFERDQLLKRGIWHTYTAQELFDPLMSSINNAINFKEETNRPVKENSVINNSKAVQRVWWQIFSSSILWLFVGMLWTMDFISSKDFSAKAFANYFTLVFQILVLSVGSTYLFALIPINFIPIRFLINMILQLWLLETLGSVMINEYKNRQTVSETKKYPESKTKSPVKKGDD